MENKKVVIENLVKSVVSINIPELRLSRTWEKKGAKKTIDLEVLKEAIYDPGTEYLFKQKILYIDDKEVRIELGLEEPDSEEEYILTDKQKKRYLTTLPVNELKSILPTLGSGQIQDLIDYAVENEIVDFERSEIIKKFTHKDIVKMVEFKRQKEEG